MEVGEQITEVSLAYDEPEQVDEETTSIKSDIKKFENTQEVISEAH